MHSEPQPGFTTEAFLGPSAAAARLSLQVARFAPHFRTVLLVGEAGAGKRSVAAKLHRLSSAVGELTLLSEAAELPARLLQADQTLYLPALEAVTLPAQEYLLHCLKSSSRDCRLIVGCTGDPRGLLAAGRLRSEALERLGTLEIRIPPLRDRTEDLPAIASAMLLRLASPHTLLPEHHKCLQAHTWKNNLLELWEVCTTFAAAGQLTLDAPSQPPPDSPLRLDDVMRHHVRTIIERCAGNKLRAAELLGISRSTLYRMMEAAAARHDL